METIIIVSMDHFMNFAMAETKFYAMFIMKMNEANIFPTQIWNMPR